MITEAINKEAPQGYKYVNYETHLIVGGGSFVDFQKWVLLNETECNELLKKWQPKEITEPQN